MIKTDYLGYNLDTIEAIEDGYEATYINYKAKHIITGEGKNCESAVAAAQKKIQLKVRG